jgi:hypothetical protein
MSKTFYILFAILGFILTQAVHLRVEQTEKSCCKKMSVEKIKKECCKKSESSRRILMKVAMDGLVKYWLQ